MIKKLFIIASLNFVLAFNLFSQSKSEAIRGIISDSRLRERIANVKIYLASRGDTIYSDSSGRFKILISNHFSDTIHFVHPGYYPYLEKIKKGSCHYLHFIQLITDSLDIDTICYPTFEGNRIIDGRVFTKYTRIPLSNSEIRLEGDKRVGYSDSNGNYKFCMPRTTNKLIFSHKDYYSTTVTWPGIKKSNTYVIKMEPLQKGFGEDFWNDDKNSVRLIVNELITGSVGIDYERFLKMRHSIGLRSSFYLYNGIPAFAPFQNQYDGNGIKLSPYYRSYFWRNQAQGLYFEGKISWGYFDYEKITYHWSYDYENSEYFSEISRSFGIGISMGLMMRNLRCPLVINGSIGLQYFPLNVPKTEQSQHGDILLEVDNTFWYIGGPGSVVEIKFMIGGIF